MAPAGAALSVDVAGARVDFHCDYKPLAEYARVHFVPLRTSSESTPVIRATLHWHEGPPPSDRLAAYPDLTRMERFDRDLYLSGDSIRWFRVDELPDFHLKFQKDATTLHIDAHYFHRLSRSARSDQLKRIVYRRRLPALRQRRFTTLLYYLVYYPAFWWLERHEGYHPIHAAGVEIDNRIILMVGPSGVGKSTLSAGLASLPGARLLSDTFILHRGVSARPVREPLLLDRWSRDWIGSGSSLLEPIEWRYCLGRDGFHWPLDRCSEGGVTSMVVFPHRSPQFDVKNVTPQAAHGRISSGDFLINDLRRYWAYAAVLEMFDPGLLVLAREENLAQLTSEIPCIDLGLTPDAKRDEIAREIRDRAGRFASPQSPRSHSAHSSTTTR